MMTAGEPGVPWPCPDGGVCHHECAVAACFRVRYCGPLSGIFPENQWPEETTGQYGGREQD